MHAISSPDWLYLVLQSQYVRIASALALGASVGTLLGALSSLLEKNLEAESETPSAPAASARHWLSARLFHFGLFRGNRRQTSEKIAKAQPCHALVDR